MSAAHCQKKDSKSSFVEVVAGEYDLSANDPSRQIRRIIKHFIHEKYVSGGVSPNDIGLVISQATSTKSVNYNLIFVKRSW